MIKDKEGTDILSELTLLLTPRFNFHKEHKFTEFKNKGAAAGW